MAHTDPMFIKYNVLKVKDILEQNHLKFLFKLSHRSLPVYFYHFVSATGFDVHTHNTRHRHNIRTPKKNTNSEKSVYVSVLLIPLIFLLVSFLIKYIHILLLVFVNILKNIILPSMIPPALFKIVMYVKKLKPNFSHLHSFISHLKISLQLVFFCLFCIHTSIFSTFNSV